MEGYSTGIKELDVYKEIMCTSGPSDHRRCSLHREAKESGLCFWQFKAQKGCGRKTKCKYQHDYPEWLEQKYCLLYIGGKCDGSCGKTHTSNFK